MERNIGLAEFIQQLRQELNKAILASSNEDLKFDLGPVGLELSITAERSVDASGKVSFMVIDAGMEGKRSAATTQLIKLVLDPRRESAPNERVSISGTDVSGER
ncbi:trypco2 family protein [Sphaerisporangium sp. NPDC088356]|uniref:trypco2 family protein n=1 Tax=Sphaerisporangium sp. NPDC088356 TaxID=3154871 RepID=UPI003423C0C0